MASFPLYDPIVKGKRLPVAGFGIVFAGHVRVVTENVGSSSACS